MYLKMSSYEISSTLFLPQSVKTKPWLPNHAKKTWKVHKILADVSFGLEKQLRSDLGTWVFKTTARVYHTTTKDATNECHVVIKCNQLWPRANFVYVPHQWETTLQCNVTSFLIGWAHTQNDPWWSVAVQARINGPILKHAVSTNFPKMHYIGVRRGSQFWNMQFQRISQTWISNHMLN